MILRRDGGVSSSLLFLPWSGLVLVTPTGINLTDLCWLNYWAGWSRDNQQTMLVLGISFFQTKHTVIEGTSALDSESTDDLQIMRCTIVRQILQRYSLRNTSTDICSF